MSVEPIDGGIISGSSEAVLTFNVSNGPPTNITCTGPNNWVIYETSDQVTRSVIDRDTTGVSIVLNQLELLEGSIQCNVSNIVDVATTAINIKSEGMMYTCHIHILIDLFHRIIDCEETR